MESLIHIDADLIRAFENLASDLYSPIQSNHSSSSPIPTNQCPPELPSQTCPTLLPTPPLLKINYDEQSFKAKQQSNPFPFKASKPKSFNTTPTLSSNCYLSNHQCIRTLTSGLGPMEYLLLDQFVNIPRLDIVCKLSSVDIAFLKDNASEPAYKLAIMAALLSTLVYSPIQYDLTQYPEYLAQVNILFEHINHPNYKAKITYTMNYYIGIACSLISSLPCFF